MAHLDLVPKTKIASFRKIAIGTWRTAYDPSVYGTLKLRMDKAMEYIEAYREKTGERLTVTHMLTKAAAEALRRCPDANAILRFNKIYLRKKVTVSVLVVQPDPVGGKVDLTAAKVEDADQKSLGQIAGELAEAVRRAREREDRQLEKSKGTIDRIPYMMMNFFLKLIGFCIYTLNLNPKMFGMPRDAFGGITITNVGSLGLDTAFVPLVPYTRVPIFVAPGAVKEEPVVEDGKVVVGKVMNVNATFDHRFIDGYHASVLSTCIREMFEDPWTHFGAIPSGEAEATEKTELEPAEKVAS